MKILAWSFIALATVLSTGCAVKVKNVQTAAEFRRSIPNDPHGHQSSITVNKSSKEVIDILTNRTAPCLDREVVKNRDQYGNAIDEQRLKYNPTLLINKPSAELSVQLLINGGGMAAGETPAKGMYIFLADVAPVSEKKTRLDIYRNEYHGAARIEESIKEWVTTKSLKCPDLNKF